MSQEHATGFAPAPVETGDRGVVISRLREDLARYARRRGGRFILFGSSATGRAGPNSDVDLVIDFEDPWDQDAWSFVERRLMQDGLSGHLMPAAALDAGLAERIGREGIDLS